MIYTTDTVTVAQLRTGDVIADNFGHTSVLASTVPELGGRVLTFIRETGAARPLWCPDTATVRRIAPRPAPR